MNGDNSMKKYVLILLLLFVFIIGIYDKSSVKSKGKYIIKHKDLTLKVIDKIYIGSMKYVGQNIYRDIFLGKNTGFTTNSLVISNGKKYAVLPPAPPHSAHGSGTKSTISRERRKGRLRKCAHVRWH